MSPRSEIAPLTQFGVWKKAVRVVAAHIIVDNMHTTASRGYLGDYSFLAVGLRVKCSSLTCILEHIKNG